MKRYFFTLLTLFLIIPVKVLAVNPKVLTLDTETNGNTISFSGTIESGSHAVMCKLYDSENHEKDMLSVSVNNGAFSGSFSVTSAGDYKVACANYEGGEIKSDTTTATQVTPTTYTITFDTNGGSPVDAIVVNAGETAQAPANPTKDGMVFDGWFEDSTFNISFNFGTSITGNLLLYAKWRAEEVQAEPVVVHTIYLGEGGTYVVDFYTTDGENQGPLSAPINHSAMYFVPAGEQMVLVAEPADGYEFKGWYSVHEVDADGHGKMEWVLDEKLNEGTTYRFVPTGSPYLAPVFEDTRTFTVRFNTNCDIVVAPVVVNYEDLVEEPERLTRDGYEFVGWYEDDTLNVEFDFNTPITDDLELYAKWEETVNEEDLVPYTVNDDFGNEISFNDEENHEFAFALLDLGKLDEADLLELTGGEIDKETYAIAEGILREAIKDHGTLISVYEIIVVNENDDPKERGPFTIKIRMTDDMKEFNSFKLLYINTDNNDFDVEETVLLDVQTIENEKYLVGTLQHLSSYVLVGNTATPTTNNPQTLDNIYVWIITLLISIVGLTISTISVRKQKVK